MMASQAEPAPAARDPTFRSYTAEQAKYYAEHRSAYNQKLYDIVLNHHTNTGGKLDLYVDLGCGPGKSTRDIAVMFDEAIGVDAGQSMIEQARAAGGKTKSGKDVRYEIMPAEELSKLEGLKPGSVDLLTAATAAHWFEMDKFWPEAAKVVKPGGTVAFWTVCHSISHPDTPNLSKVREITQRLMRDELGPYSHHGNLIAHNYYDRLELPWNLTPPVTAFPRSAFVKNDYDRDGVAPGEEPFNGGWREFTPQQAGFMLSTTSQVTRWREAHPELVGTEEDIITKYVREFEEALPKDQQMAKAGGSFVLVMLKRGEE